MAVRLRSLTIWQVGRRIQWRLRLQQQRHESIGRKHGRVPNIRLHAHYHGPYDIGWQHLLSGLPETNHLDHVQDNARQWKAS